MFLINTFLGLLIVQLYDVFTRQRKSANTPSKFSFSFFIKDNWRKMVVSLLLSLTTSTAVFLNLEAFCSFLHISTDMKDVIFVVIGASPEFILQKFKKKFGVLQPNNVNGYRAPK